MKSFDELWEEFEPNNKPYTLGIKPFIEAWFNRGAKEKEKEMLEFARWYIRASVSEFPSDLKEAYMYWKENIKENSK